MDSSLGWTQVKKESVSLKIHEQKPPKMKNKEKMNGTKTQQNRISKNHETMIKDVTYT